MNNYNFILSIVDTDSIAFSKQDGGEISKEEQQNLIAEINSFMPEKIRYADDGYYTKAIVFKAKNYILFNEKEIEEKKRIKIKGSALKSSKLEPALKQMYNEMIKEILYKNDFDLIAIYNKYINLALNVNKDTIKDWSQKKTITKPIIECKDNLEARKNERDIYNAIKHTSFQEGDKIYVYPAILNKVITVKEYKNGKTKESIELITGLKLYEEFDQSNVNKYKLVDRVVDSVNLFKNIVGDEYFINYKLVKNRGLLNA